MRLNVLCSFIGFVILIAATYCPILRPFHLFSWDAYSANKPMGIVILLIAVVGILGTVFSQPKIVKLTAWLSLGMVVLFYIAALIKVHTSFSFIPIHPVGNYLAGLIKFKWGWYLLFGGPVLAIAGVLAARKPVFNNDSFTQQNLDGDK